MEIIKIFYIFLSLFIVQCSVFTPLNPLEISTINLVNNKSVNENAEKVLKDILISYSEHVKAPPAGHGLKKIMIKHFDKYPYVVWDKNSESYIIYLTVQKNNYQQLTYQFAHEICHIYINTETTSWFIESICELSALYFLEYLSKKWKYAPPLPELKNYSNELVKYKEITVSDYYNKMKLTNNSEIGEILKEKTKTLKTPFDRNYNFLVAKLLLPVFESDKKSWEILPYLGLATNRIKGVNNSYYEVSDLEKLETLVPDDLKKFFKRIREKV